MTTSTTPVLELEGLSAGYDAAVAVRDLDLHVGAGEVVALLGPNGAGKTTTLRAISGLIRPMAGVIRVDGNDLARQSPAARAQLGIAHVPEGRGVFFGLTVAEHFRLGYRGERLDADLAYTYFPALAALRDRRAGLLSGGEQQMLTLGTALARKPRLMLVDELSLGLAPVIVERLMPVVSAYAKQSGCAVLVVEQHIHIALEVADRGYVLSHGELVIHAPADELRADHQLILSGYLGERTASANRPGSTTMTNTETSGHRPDPARGPTPSEARSRFGASSLFRQGAGAPVLVLHAAGGAGMWNPYLERLSEHFDVIAPDHPGFGLSPALDGVDSIATLVEHYLSLLDSLHSTG